MSLLRPLIAGAVGTLLVSGVAAPAWAGGPAGATPHPGGAAPGAPGIDEQYLPATKSGVVTSTPRGEPRLAHRAADRWSRRGVLPDRGRARRADHAVRRRRR